MKVKITKTTTETRDDNGLKVDVSTEYEALGREVDVSKEVGSRGWVFYNIIQVKEGGFGHVRLTKPQAEEAVKLLAELMLLGEEEGS